MESRNRRVIVRVFNWFRNQELLVLILSLLVVTGVWGFVELADEVGEGDTQEFDEWAVRSLRTPGTLDDAIGPRWFEEVMRDFTALGSVAVLTLVTSATAGFLLLKRQFHALYFLMAALGGGLVLNFFLKSWFDRPRPELVPHLAHVSTASFPSGHSLLSTVVYFTLAALLARMALDRRHKVYIVCIALLFSFLVGISRIYLGVHYPTDVLAGWALGIVWAILCWFGARYLQRRGAVERPSESQPVGAPAS